ncbi:DCN1-like protein [Bienertia sinuspersici]
MEYSFSTQFDIFSIYRRFSDIKAGNIYPGGGVDNMLNDDSEKVRCFREAMFQLSKLVHSSVNTSLILGELHKLMSCLNMGDFSEFSNFYDFVFFVCRENGQKNITVSRAIAAWKIVLSGRFRLLNQWCDFVEKNQQYNISEDTWRQVLAFSRCVHEDLEGYDPEGAWPTLIDEFVEHMYRITGSNNCSSNSLTCNVMILMVRHPCLKNLFQV